MQQVLIHQILLKKTPDLAHSKSDVDKLDVDKLKNIPSHLSNQKSKTDVLDVDKLVPVPVDLIKLSYLVKNDIVKKDVYNAISTVLKIKYLILLTQLLMLLLMLK